MGSESTGPPNLARVIGLSPMPQCFNELAETPDGTSPVPDEQCDEIRYRILQNLVYGYRTWRSLFNARQLYVLGSLCEAVREAHDAMRVEMTSSRAVAITTYLGLCVDRIADHNSMFASWVPGGEFIQKHLSESSNPNGMGPYRGRSLLGDFRIWNGAVKWIERALRNCSSASDSPARVERGNAQQLPFPTILSTQSSSILRITIPLCTPTSLTSSMCG